jgi:5-methylcytosine-specific restriction endonuclease McrA
MGLLAVIVAVLVIWIAARVIRYIRKERYFASEAFQAHKADIASFVREHNEVAQYTAEIRSKGSFQVGASSSGSHAHLAQSQNTSHWNYRRDRNVANYQARNVHNCSLQVVRNASADPLKYVMKYFNIKADESTLGDVERLSESIVRLEGAVSNLQQREASITQAFNPPRFILKHYKQEFMSQVGVEVTPLTVPYPVYVFEYVSAGGNSGQKATVTLNTPTIDALIETLGQKIRWRKSAAGQRALMTAKLRGSIKARDNHTCKICSVSVAAEPHLLLEVDHIVPVSRGGLSIPENLQTLCWRCNRSKSNKTAPTATTPVAQQMTPPALPTTEVGVVRPESTAATAPRTVPTSEVEGQLVKLRDLYEAGLFTDAEYEAKKSDLLNRS